MYWQYFPFNIFLTTVILSARNGAIYDHTQEPVLQETFEISGRALVSKPRIFENGLQHAFGVIDTDDACVMRKIKKKTTNSVKNNKHEQTIQKTNKHKQ